MSTKETLEKIKSFFSSDNVEAGINLIETLDDSKLNSEILKGCSLDEAGKVIINDITPILSQYDEIKYYLSHTYSHAALFELYIYFHRFPGY